MILALLAKTLPQVTIGRDKCSTSGAQYRFVVVQYPRITERKTSARRTTELGSRVKPSFNVVVEFDDLVDRHGVSRFGGAVEPIALSTDGSLIDYFRAESVSARKA